MRKWIGAVLFASLVVVPSSSAEEGHVRAVYGNYSYESIRNVLELFRKTEINAVVLDIKGDDGRELLESQHRSAIVRFKSEGAYVICRLVTLKDSKFARKYPHLAFKSKKTGKLWSDYRKDHWLDPAAKEVRQFIAGTAVAAYGVGCDEVNFDYIRYPSAVDANVFDISFPFTVASDWRSSGPAKREAMKGFMNYLQDSLAPRVYSADLFGYTFLFGSEPAIGQYTEAFAAAGFILSGMQYPTHYGCNDAMLKVRDPSLYPFVVHNVTLEKGIAHLKAKNINAKIRPWIQAFSIYNICRYTKKGCPKGCGGKMLVYGHSEMQEQVDALAKHGIFSWMAWDSRSIYNPNHFKKRGAN